MLKKIYTKIRLFKLRQKEPYLSFYKILGFYPNNIEIYEQAFLHRSSSIKTDQGRWVNNERLEFLGDAILDAIVADILFQEFDTKKEGFLTNTRSKIVQRENLNKLALNLGLDKLIVSSTRINTHNSYIYGNAFEAFIGAIYIDKGYETCKRFLEDRVIKPYVNLNSVAKKEVNFKSKLIEWGQKNKKEVEFSLIESFTDKDNNPIFQTQILVAGLSGGVGIGYSKKESQQNAAKMALKKIQTDKTFYDSVFEETPTEVNQRIDVETDIDCISATQQPEAEKAEKSDNNTLHEDLDENSKENTLLITDLIQSLIQEEKETSNIKQDNEQ